MTEHKFSQVTVAEYWEFLGANPSRELPIQWTVQRERPWQPVVYVSAFDADAFAAWSGRRLPTEEEWMADCATPGFDRQAPALYDWTADVDGGSGRVLRGGSWGGGAEGLRASSRFRYSPGARLYYLGFRCARTDEVDKAEAQKEETDAP